MQRWNFLAEQVKAVIKDYPMLKLTQGRKVGLFIHEHCCLLINSAMNHNIS
jgi:hypothetical protein